MSEPPPVGLNRWPPPSAAPSRPVQVWPGTAPAPPVGSPNPTLGWGGPASSNVGPGTAALSPAAFNAGTADYGLARAASGAGIRRRGVNRDLIWLLIAVLGLIVLLCSFLLWDRPIKTITPAAELASARLAFAVLRWPALLFGGGG